MNDAEYDAAVAFVIRWHPQAHWADLITLITRGGPPVRDGFYFTHCEDADELL